MQHRLPNPFLLSGWSGFKYGSGAYANPQSPSSQALPHLQVHWVFASYWTGMRLSHLTLQWSGSPSPWQCKVRPLSLMHLAQKNGPNALAAAERCNRTQLISTSGWDFAMVFLAVQYHEMSATADWLDFPQLWVPHKVSKYEQRESGKVPYDIGNPSGREQAGIQTSYLLATFTYLRACTAWVTVGRTGQILLTCSALIRLHTVSKRKGRCREEKRDYCHSVCL